MSILFYYFRTYKMQLVILINLIAKVVVCIYLISSYYLFVWSSIGVYYISIKLLHCSLYHL